MSARTKRTRILTNRNFPNGLDWEALELEEYNGHQYLYWRAVDGGAECCFPVPMQFAQELFAEQGRAYVPSGRERYKLYTDPFWGEATLE